MDPKRTKLLGSVIAASALVLALGAAPMIGFGADHLDAPNLTAPSMRPDADINDVYAFPGNNEKRTVIAVTTHPAAGAIAPLEYATDVKYTIKIDRTFVAGIDGAADRSIVEAVIALAHGLGIGVVAEGIETDSQVERLRELGCDLGQGYLFSRPVPAERTAALLRDRPRAARSLRAKAVRARQLRQVI